MDMGEHSNSQGTHSSLWAQIRPCLLSLACTTMPQCLLSPLLFNILLEILTGATRQEKEIEGIQVGKEKVKLSLSPDDTLLYIEHLRIPQKNPARTNK